MQKILYIDDQQEFIKTSADYILAEALSNVSKKGSFTISLTGGSTPVKIYETLTKSPYKDIFPWNKTYFFLGDERILSSNNPESNSFMINQTLFSKVSIPIENIILPNINLNNPQEISKDYESKIKDFFKDDKLSFDLLLLGMGIDCHTASLFPDDLAWKTNDNIVISTSRPIGNPKVFRVSMNLPLINQSKNILMLISGQTKREVANELLKNMNIDENPANSPIPEIDCSGEFTWLIN